MDLIFLDINENHEIINKLDATISEQHKKSSTVELQNQESTKKAATTNNCMYIDSTAILGLFSTVLFSISLYFKKYF